MPDPGDYVRERGRAVDALRGYPRRVEGPYSWNDEPPLDVALTAYTDGPYHSRRLTITADLWVPADAVTAAYRAVQAGQLGRTALQHRRSAKTMALVRFSFEHPRRQPYRELMERWNAGAPDAWQYRDSDRSPAYRRFRRDYLAARDVAAELLAPYRAAPDRSHLGVAHE